MTAPGCAVQPWRDDVDLCPFGQFSRMSRNFKSRKMRKSSIEMGRVRPVMGTTGINSALPLGLDLGGRVAIVTGGTRGLGLRIALALAGAGAQVVVCGRNAPDDLPAPLVFRAADIRDPDQARALVDGVAADFGGIDILVNNAGGSPQAAAAEASPRFFDAILKLNLHAAMYMAQAAYPHMQASVLGRAGAGIINIASVAGIRPSPMTSAYGAAKAGLLSLTQSLAQEWGPVGIRVNAIIVGRCWPVDAAATDGHRR
eukprot:gene8105-8186_t